MLHVQEEPYFSYRTFGLIILLYLFDFILLYFVITWQ